MAKEIERKFLVISTDYRLEATGMRTIAQGYLSTDPDRTVRVRITDHRGFITVKTRNNGAERNEWEYEIPVSDASAMLSMACSNVIEKRRYLVPSAQQGLVWEIDEFEGHLAPLVVAEIELPTAGTPFARPDWLGEEVTGDERYYNSNLAAQA